MKNHIYCFYAILWSFLMSLAGSLDRYIGSYLLDTHYSRDVESIASFLTVIIWGVPFVAMMVRGLTKGE